MKILSEYKELEGTVFDSVKACQDAEKRIDEQRKALSAKEKDASKLRKTLAQEVDVAEKALTDAYAQYDKAKEEVKKIVEECNSRINAVLEPARKAVNDAEANRTAAIINYNKKCGPYQKTYTGDRAVEEYERINKYFNSIWNSFFRF